MKTQKKKQTLVFDSTAIIELNHSELTALKGGTGVGIISGDDIFTRLTRGSY